MKGVWCSNVGKVFLFSAPFLSTVHTFWTGLCQYPARKKYAISKIKSDITTTFPLSCWWIFFCNDYYVCTISPVHNVPHVRKACGNHKQKTCYSRWKTTANRNIPLYNIARALVLSHSVYVSVLKIPIVLADSVSKLLRQKCFVFRASGH